MPLAYQPRVGAIVLCDFKGMISPEMVKNREVVVIAAHKHNSKLVTVVPLSSTAPSRAERYHHKLSHNPRPGGDPEQEIWVKCDMIYTVCLERMSLHYSRSRRKGRQVEHLTLPAEDLVCVRKCVAVALQLQYTASVP